MGIRQSIQNAKTVSEVVGFLAKANSYQHASEKTLRSCKRTADRRIAELAK